MQPSTALRDLINAPETIQAPGVYDGLSARMAEESGFKAAYVTGGGSSVAVLGKPDLGLMTFSEMASHIGRLCDTVDIPLIADADTGYGNALNVQRTVRAFERAGAAALHLEDQAFPKRCGHLSEKRLVSKNEFIGKIKAAVDTRDGDMSIIARTDAREPVGLDEAIERGNAYADAGADVVFVEAPRSHAEIERIAANVDAPLLLNVIAKSNTPPVNLEWISELGYAIAIYPLASITAACHAIKEALAELLDTGSDDRPGKNMSPKEIFEIVGLSGYQHSERQYAG